jgi:DNA modification methylase
VTPYYEDDAVTLYHGDCLEILDGLPNESVDAVITDPPYASGARTEATKAASGAMVPGRREERYCDLIAKRLSQGILL